MLGMVWCECSEQAVSGGGHSRARLAEGEAREHALLHHVHHVVPHAQAQHRRLSRRRTCESHSNADFKGLSRAFVRVYTGTEHLAPQACHAITLIGSTAGQACNLAGPCVADMRCIVSHGHTNLTKTTGEALRQGGPACRSGAGRPADCTGASAWAASRTRRARPAQTPPPCGLCTAHTARLM